MKHMLEALSKQSSCKVCLPLQFHRSSTSSFQQQRGQGLPFFYTSLSHTGCTLPRKLQVTLQNIQANFTVMYFCGTPAQKLQNKNILIRPLNLDVQSDSSSAAKSANQSARYLKWRRGSATATSSTCTSANCVVNNFFTTIIQLPFIHFPLQIDCLHSELCISLSLAVFSMSFVCKRI